MPIISIEKEIKSKIERKEAKKKLKEALSEKYEKAKKEVIKKLPKYKGLGRKKLLSKKKTKQLVKPISSTKLMKSFAGTTYGHVNPAPERVYADDNRSLFFKTEFDNEKKKIGKWGWL